MESLLLSRLRRADIVSDDRRVCRSLVGVALTARRVLQAVDCFHHGLSLDDGLNLRVVAHVHITLPCLLLLSQLGRQVLTQVPH